MLATAPAPDAGAGGLAQNENAPGAEAGARVEQSGCSMPPPILRDAALAHAKRGRPVFPCNPSADPEKGKKPLTEHGFKDATTDAEQIKLWWTKWPNALIGMPTGAISKCFVLDVDVDEAKGKNGEESLSKLINGHGALPDTVEAMTPRGGRHIYFKHPGGASIQNSTSKIGKDLDIRGDGGYVILPPSRLENGKQYDWEGSSSPDDGVKAVYAPDWLLELVIEHPKPPQQQEPVADQIEEGKRNDTLFRLGRSLRAKGLGERAILAALREENMAKCCPPLSDDEVRILVGSACTKPPGQALPTDTDSIPLLRGEKRDAWLAPTPLPARGTHGEAPTFPLNLLPEPVQVAAREVARFAKVPEAAPGLVGVSAIATAVGKRAMVEERPGLTHYASMFLGGIAVTGERKSGSFKPMTAPLKDWTEDQGPVWEAATRKAKARNVALDAALTEAKAKAKKGGVGVAERAIEELEAQRLPLPPHPRLFTSDATEQRLFQLMHDRGGCFAVLSGEGRPVIDAIMGKYSGVSGGPNPRKNGGLSGVEGALGRAASCAEALRMGRVRMAVDRQGRRGRVGRSRAW